MISARAWWAPRTGSFVRTKREEAVSSFAMAAKEVPFSPSITNRFVRTDDSSLMTADRSCEDCRTTERVPSAANRSIAAGVTDGSITCVRRSGAAAKAVERTLSPALYSVSMTDPRPPAMREPESMETKGRLRVWRVWVSGRTEESPGLDNKGCRSECEWRRGRAPQNAELFASPSELRVRESR